MLKEQINRLVKRYGPWELIRGCLIGGLLILICVFVLELAIPVRLNSVEPIEAYSSMNLTDSNNFFDILQPKDANLEHIRAGLFKASTPLRDKPMADKTIERIKSQLKLQCIMEMNGEPTAYINIDGVGLKKCNLGDSINDLFTVVNINKTTVEITVVDHKITLSL